jgi:putative Holliday junction resolvase
MTIIALDIGSARTGLAISHGIIAEALCSIDCRRPESLLVELKKVVNAQKADKIIIGLPLGKDGAETIESKRIRQIAAQIEEHLDLKYDFVEESYSTVEAVRRFDQDLKKRSELRKFDKDSEAAKIILEQYLNQLKESENNES